MSQPLGHECKHFDLLGVGDWRGRDFVGEEDYCLTFAQVDYMESVLDGKLWRRVEGIPRSVHMRKGKIDF